MSRVYVGGLTAETQKQELEDTFSKFGRLETVWVARQPPGFAFITFADAKDAEDACRAENANPKGWRVEISSGGRGGGGRGRGVGGRDGGPSQGRYDGAPPGRDDRGRDDYGRGRDSGRDYSRRSPSPRRRSRSPERRRSSPERRRSRSGDRERRRSRSGERRRSRDRR